ncbi:uncharacterized protein si:ch73-140j24.4 [Hoplias malabaricus]|uniref:uncharacterized protein si:ch73-140j24.4 n=1 Tax=Hoplias malabaricus TaxID=27720 RepID=UPI0034631599
MMRFILDCLRAGRRRAACARENSVELQAKEREAAAENEIKDLEDVVAMEEGALQKERTLSQETQQALERLAKRRAQLKEEIEGIQEKRSQEGQLLLSLQEEQEELQQAVQEYEEELKRATDELQHLQDEIAKTRGRVEDAHGQMGPLKHSIGETYSEITEAKERLSELIAEMIAIEACVPEITCHQVGEPLSLDLDEEEDDAEECYGDVYEEENSIKSINVVKEQEQYAEGLEKLQRSVENLKSSGSSSFTEITLTEVKEEDVSPRSDTPQNMDSPDLEEEGFEIVQTLDTKPISQTSSREFDFFHPDPFVDHDVFGDDRFPKVDMTEFLSGDPFKGSDPFASDMLFNDVADAHFSQDYPLNEESILKESDSLSSVLQSTSKTEDADTSRVVAHISAGANCSQSIDSGMFEQNVPEPTDSERYTPYSDICPNVGINITISQEPDGVELSNTITEINLPESSHFDDGGRFDPIHCELNDSHEFLSSDSSTVDSSFDGDFGTFTGMEHQVVEPEAKSGPSYVRRNQALYGLQRIDTSSYTSFPLSPEECPPEPDFPAMSNKEESVQVADPFSYNTDHAVVSTLKLETEETENYPPPIQPGIPSACFEELGDPCDTDDPDQARHSPEPIDTDAYDHKFGDIYFFTVRLDPGSPDASPVSAEGNDRNKSECDHTSPESNDTDDFECGGPEDDDPNHYSLEGYVEESFDKEESTVRTERPLSLEQNEPMQSESEMLSPREDLPYPDHENQSVFNLESTNNMTSITDNTEKVPVSTADTSSENCIIEPVIQYLISPVSDTEMVTTDGYKLCSHNPFSLDSGSTDHCDEFENNTEAFNTGHSNAEESELEASEPFDSVPTDDQTYKSEFQNLNSVSFVSTDGGRLDSGYHENSGLESFNPAHSNTYPSTDLAPSFVSPSQEMLSPGVLDLVAPDPFSPESNDTLIFDSEICVPSTNDGVNKDSCQVYTASSDIFGDSFSGSEFDSFDPFSPFPHALGGSYTHCNMDILIPESTQNNSKSDVETRSSSCDSGVSYSPQLHYGSAQNREDSNTAVISEAQTKQSFFETDSMSITDASSLESKNENITEQDKNSPENITAMAELAEIDFFCSELSKMVASRSSDSVQQSVAEMLFGSNPDTARFYPWDFENSNMVVNEPLSPEDDFGSSNKLSRDLPNLEAGTRSHRASDLLGELQNTVGHTFEGNEKPCLL